MAATITRPAASVARNTLQTIPWLGITKPVHVASRSDWFGLYVTTDADYEPTAWRMTPGTAGGSATLYIPDGIALTTYELRLFSGHNQAKLATSATFTITAGTPPSVTVPGAASANDVITVSWSGIPDPQSTDYLELRDVLQAVYSAPVLTGGGAAGSVPLHIPSATPVAAGYRVYLWRAPIVEYGLAPIALALSNTLDITAGNVPTLVSPGAQTAGALVSATWANIVSPAPSLQDWVGLFAIGAPASAPLGWRYLDGTASGSLPFVIPAHLGTASYELRLYSGADQSLLATSASFAVTALP